MKELQLISLDILSEIGYWHELEVHLDIAAGDYLGTARWPQEIGQKITGHLRTLGIEVRPDTAIGGNKINVATFSLPGAGPVEADNQLRDMFAPVVHRLGETDWSFSSDQSIRPVHALLVIDNDPAEHDDIEIIRSDPRSFDNNDAGTRRFIESLLTSGLCSDAGMQDGRLMLYCELTPEAAADRAKTFEAIVGLYAEAAT